MRELIEEARRNGYAAVADELAYGVIALAVPVFDHHGLVVAALNSSKVARISCARSGSPRALTHCS